MSITSIEEHGAIHISKWRVDSHGSDLILDRVTLWLSLSFELDFYLVSWVPARWYIIRETDSFLDQLTLFSNFYGFFELKLCRLVIDTFS